MTDVREALDTLIMDTSLADNTVIVRLALTLSAVSARLDAADGLRYGVGTDEIRELILEMLEG